MKAIALLGLLIGMSGQAAVPTGRYKTVIDKLDALETKYSSFASRFSIGKNDDGIEIYALRVSATPSAPDPKKVAHLVVATHHGNEGGAAAFALHFTEELLKRYRSGGTFRNDLADAEWTIIPVLNVSGYNANRREEHGRDPNRDYPGICSGSTGGKLKSIRLLMDHMATRTYSGSLTVHGYQGALTYPWGVQVDNTHTADHNTFEKMTAKAAGINGYQHGTSTDIVYAAEGAYEDYAYWKYGMWSLLLELRNGSDSDIRTTSDAIFTYFEQVDSSPSSQHSMTAHCNRERSSLDFRNE